MKFTNNVFHAVRVSKNGRFGTFRMAERETTAKNNRYAVAYFADGMPTGMFCHSDLNPTEKTWHNRLKFFLENHGFKLEKVLK